MDRARRRRARRSVKRNCRAARATTTQGNICDIFFLKINLFIFLFYLSHEGFGTACCGASIWSTLTLVSPQKRTKKKPTHAPRMRKTRSTPSHMYGSARNGQVKRCAHIYSRARVSTNLTRVVKRCVLLIYNVHKQ